jgi:hypothetical protein
MKRVLWIFPIVFLIIFTACGGSTDPSNAPPEIIALTASDSIVSLNETIDITCEAIDHNGDELTYSWEASSGVITGSGSNIAWTSPAVPGMCGITCTVSDNDDSDSLTIEIDVIDNEAPEIIELTASDSIVSVNQSVDISCEAVDPDGDELTYSWEASAGVIEGSGSIVDWTAPAIYGTCGITCTVSDDDDSDSSTIEIEVVFPKLKIEPAEQTIAVDEEAVFSVQLYNGVDVFALSVEIVFNNGVVGAPINSVTIGDFWGDDAIITTQIEYDRLCVAIGQIQTAGDDGITGDGTLFEFILVGLLAGESDITFENLSLIDENGDPIEGFDEMELVNGLIIVE